MSETPENNTAAELADEVSGHVREGKMGRAKRAFHEGWRDAVPELPLRFSVILVRLDRDVAKELRRLARQGKEQVLLLSRTGESQVDVIWEEENKRLGSLPAEDARLLGEYGEDADLYRPQLLEIRYEEGRLDHVAIELVRPEVRYCPSCGKKHTGPYINCDECRKKGRKGRKDDSQVEAPPVLFHEALDTLVQETQDTEE